MSMDSDYVCTLEPKYVKKAKDELFEVPEDRLAAVQAFREWILNQPHITADVEGLDAMHLLVFLRWAKWSQIRARERLEAFLTMKIMFPKVYKDIDPQEDDLMHILKSGYFLAPKVRTPAGEQVIIFRMEMWTMPYAMSMFMRLGQIGYFLHYYDEMNHVNGVNFIIDYSGVSTKAMKKIMGSESQEIFKHYLSKTPGRWKAVKFYRAGVLFETFLLFFKALMPKKLVDRISCHETMETIYPTIPMQCLPVEYLPDDYKGPNAGTIDQINEQFIADASEIKFRKRLQYLTSDAFTIDESKRPTVPVTSHFRKLNVD